MQNHFVLADGTLGLRTNLASFKWSYGINAPPSTEDAYRACAVRLTLLAEDWLDDPTPDADDMGKYHYFRAQDGADALFYRRTFVFGRMLRMDISGLLTPSPTFRVNPAHLRFVTHRFMNLHSMGYVLTDAASLLLLQKGYAPLHCSAFKYGDATVVILAPPNTGKTLSAMSACMDHGAHFLAEDLAITDAKDVIAVPWTSTFRYYANIDDSLRSRVRQSLVKRLPFVELVPPSAPARITSLLAGDRVLARSRITHVVLLERGQRGVRAADAGSIARKAINLNRYEFNYVKAPTLVAYEYFNPSLNIEEAHLTEHRLINQMVANAAERIVVSSPDPTEYAQLIFRAITGAGN